MEAGQESMVHQRLVYRDENMCKHQTIALQSRSKDSFYQSVP